jgi:tartrate-resistant acid phosphatase type 5
MASSPRVSSKDLTSFPVGTPVILDETRKNAVVSTSMRNLGKKSVVSHTISHVRPIVGPLTIAFSIVVIVSTLIGIAIGVYAIAPSPSVSSSAAVPVQPSSQPLPPPAANANANAMNPAYITTQDQVNSVLVSSSANGTDRVTFMAFGDWGRCYSTSTNPVTVRDRCYSQRRQVAAMESWAAAVNPVAIISTGDQFYDGPTEGDADPMFDYSFRNIYDTPNLRNKPWFLIQGNHDYEGSLAAQLGWGIRAPLLPNSEKWDVRWNAPSLNYSMAYNYNGGCVAMVFIDTCPFMDTYRNSNTAAGPTRSPSTGLNEYFYSQLNVTVPGDQLEWIRQQIINASNSCDAVMVIGHHAVFSSGQHARAARQTDLRIRLNFPDVFAYIGVDAYLNGHEHIVEHLENKGTHYYVTGAGSDVRTNNILVPESKYLLADNGFTIHSFNATHASHAVIAYNGTVMDSIVVPLLSKLRNGRNEPMPTVPWFANPATL